MSNKYFSGKNSHYIFCDICGKPCYDYEVTKLQQFTGRPGLLVCPLDADTIDFGLVPYTIGPEKSVKWARVNHQSVIGSDPLNTETTTSLGV